MIELTGVIKKVASVVKDGDIIIEITLAHNLTESGTLSTAGALVAIQDKTVTCGIEVKQAELEFVKK